MTGDRIGQDRKGQDRTSLYTGDATERLGAMEERFVEGLLVGLRWWQRTGFCIGVIV